VNYGSDAKQIKNMALAAVIRMSIPGSDAATRP
jgi:hypothetical protein